MENLLYVLAAIFIIAWGIGFFLYSASAIIHFLLVLAFVSILLRISMGHQSLR
jgi:hypothetical protein